MTERSQQVVGDRPRRRRGFGSGATSRVRMGIVAGGGPLPRVSSPICERRAWDPNTSMPPRSRSSFGSVPGSPGFNQPLLVVPSLERPEGRDEFGNRGEVLDPKQVLLEDADEPLGTAVALRLSHEARRALPCRGRSSSAAGSRRSCTHCRGRGGSPEPTGDASVEPAEVLPYPQPQRLQRLEPVAAL